jgi:hypothetical protein
MNHWILISVFEVVGSALCVASADGQKIYTRIARVLKEGGSANVSFRNVNTLTSAFLNAAIGQLYGEFDNNDIRNRIRVEEMESDDIKLLKRVVETAKEYFKDPDRFEHTVRATMGDENGSS